MRDGRFACANLGGADLSGADLREANLRWADFSGANLTGVDFESVIGAPDLSESCADPDDPPINLPDAAELPKVWEFCER